MLLFCVKTIVKESRKFKLAHLKKKKKKKKKKKRRKKNILAVWRPSGLVLSRCYLAPMGVLFVMKHSKMNGKLAVLEILRNLFVLAYIACPHYPYI